VAAPDAKRINARAATDKAFLARALKNPGLRAKLDPKYLSKTQAASRALNTRLNAPITPGSTTTERDLAHQAEAATTVKYGPQDRKLAEQLGVSRQTEQDTSGFYDQYRQALQQHATNVQAYQAGAQQALQQTAQGITGLGQQAAVQMQQQANAGAATQGVAPAGDLSALANAAMATRQGVMGSFQNQATLQGQAANTYADTQANVVAPGQKLSALAQARGKTKDIQQKQADLATEKGAYNQTFRDTRRQDEFKNQLAAGALNLNTAKAAADIKANDPATVVATAGGKAAATEEAKQAAKYGYSVHQWRLLGPKARATAIAKSDKTTTNPGSDVITSGPLAGKTKTWVAAHPGEAGKLVDAYNTKSGAAANPKTASAKAFRDKYGVDLQTTTQHNTARDAIQNAQTAFGQVGKVITVKDAAGNPVLVNGKPKQVRVTTDMVVSALRNGGKNVTKTAPLWIRAGLEMARGGLTPGTAARIHKAGYSVATLGYKMRPAASSPSTPTGAAGYNGPT
jgi:hypothetical protein